MALIVANKDIVGIISIIYFQSAVMCFFPNCQAKITDFIKKVVWNYIGVKIGDQDKQFAPPRLL